MISAPRRPALRVLYQAQTTEVHLRHLPGALSSIRHRSFVSANPADG